MLCLAPTTVHFSSNVLFCNRQVDVNWGGFSMIEATVSLMNELRDSCICPDYVHLLSGQDFPLSCPKEFDQFFENNYGKNFVEYHTIPSQGWAGNGGWDRINFKWDMDNSERKSSSACAVQENCCMILPAYDDTR